MRAQPCNRRKEPGGPAFTIRAPISKMKAGATLLFVVVVVDVVVVECARRDVPVAEHAHLRGRHGSGRACIAQWDATRPALDADIDADLDADAESAAMVDFDEVGRRTGRASPVST